MRRIDSRDNAVFREMQRLRQVQKAQEPNVIFLEGVRLCGDAVMSGVSVVRLVLTERAAGLPAVQNILGSLPDETDTILLSDRLFALLSDTKTPQGIAIFCVPPLLTTIDQPADPNGLYLALEGVQDPGNLGTLIRTAAAFAFQGVLLLPGTVSPFNEKTLRSTMGACFHIPLIQVPDVASLRDYLHKADLKLYAADLAGQSSHAAPFDRPGALLIGNEAHGLSDQARELSDQLIHIPMPGRAESLNAAAAGSILCYELRRAFPSGPGKNTAI
jgi:TrmH family RNA methyltransferase